MWQAPNQKMRGGKKRGASRSQRPFHIKRVLAELRRVSPANQAQPDQEQPIQVRLLLNDLSPLGMGVFCTESLIVGQEVAVMVSDPSMIYLRGRVAYCQEFDIDSHVMSKVSFSYRVGIHFKFESPLEEAAVKKYCDDLMRTLLRAA